MKTRVSDMRTQEILAYRPVRITRIGDKPKAVAPLDNFWQMR